MTGPDEQPPPADGPAEVRAEALLLERAIGGWRGVIDSGLPTAVFVIAYVVTGGTLRTSLIAAIAAGVLIVGWRLIRREKLGQVAAGFAGLAISAWWASRNDNASDLYIPGMLTNLGYGTAFLEQIVTNGRSNYHALQSKLQRRMRGGLGFTASYTYSTAKADFLDHLSAGQGASGNFPQNAYDMGADYGPVAFDVPHRFVLSFVAELPAGKGRKKEFKGAAAILNNWSVNGILSLNSGRPFTATATDASNTGAGHQSRANCSGDAQPGSFDKTIDKWFDTSKFSQPTALTFGNCGSNTLRGPGQKSMNASIFRSFPLPNDRRIEFRAEAFNVFNWKNYALPGASVANTATFGRITSTLGDVREMQFAVKLYW